MRLLDTPKFEISGDWAMTLEVVANEASAKNSAADRVFIQSFLLYWKCLVRWKRSKFQFSQKIIDCFDRSIREADESAAAVSVAYFDEPRLRGPAEGGAGLVIKKRGGVVEAGSAVFGFGGDFPADGGALPVFFGEVVGLEFVDPPILVGFVVEFGALGFLRPVAALLDIGREWRDQVAHVVHAGGGLEAVQEVRTDRNGQGRKDGDDGYDREEFKNRKTIHQTCGGKRHARAFGDKFGIIVNRRWQLRRAQ